MQNRPSQNTSETDVIIVGAGLIGLSIAYRLAKRGKKVLIIEKEKVGTKASWASGGMIQPVKENSGDPQFLKVCMDSASMYPAFVAEIEKDSGMDVEYQAKGGIILAFDEEEKAKLKEKQTFVKENGFQADLLDRRKVLEKEPAINASVVAGLFVPSEAQVNNRNLVAALRKALSSFDVLIEENNEVTGLMETDTVIGVKTKKGERKASETIICAGAWTSQLLDQTHIIPIRGQMIRYDAKSLRTNGYILVHHPHYAIPRKDGSMIIGSTMDDVGFADHPTEAGIAELKAAAHQFIPRFKNCPLIEIWSGLRPTNEDSLPIIGKVKEGLHVAAGHFRTGILLAPLTSKLIEQEIMTGIPNKVYAVR